MRARDVLGVYSAIKQKRRHRRHRKHRVIGPRGQEGQTDHYAAVYTLYGVRPPRGKRLTVRSGRPEWLLCTIFFLLRVRTSGSPPSAVRAATLCGARRLLI